MDIYSIINSKAISEHCRKIAHQFTPLEMAYLVYANDGMNIAQKHAAFNKIIAQCPDMEVVERTWTPHFDGLRVFLGTYMDTQNKYLAVFFKDEPNCIYSFEVQYSGDDATTEDGRIFTNYTACYHALKTDIDDLVADYAKSEMVISPVDIKVRKRWINTELDAYPRQITISIDYGGNPVDIWADTGVISSVDNDVLCAFDGLWPEIPTPFQKGDILVAKNKYNVFSEPFVLDWIPYWEEDGRFTKVVSNLRENGDCSDLITSIYGQDKDGTVWNDHGPSYLALDYCEQELFGTEKILVAISHYLKGELPLELLIRAYDILKTERRAKEDRDLISGFYGDLILKAGL